MRTGNCGTLLLMSSGFLGRSQAYVLEHFLVLAAVDVDIMTQQHQNPVPLFY